MNLRFMVRFPLLMLRINKMKHIKQQTKQTQIPGNRCRNMLVMPEDRDNLKL